MNVIEINGLSKEYRSGLLGTTRFSAVNNLNLSVGPGGEVVVVGDRGGLVVGRPGQWTAIDARTDFNLQGVAHFAGETFVCTDFEIFRLIGGKLLRETRFVDDKRPATCMNLMAGGNCLYAQGERDLYRFQDGSWASVL